MMQSMSEGGNFLLLRGNIPQLTQDQAMVVILGMGMRDMEEGPDGGKGKKMPKDNKPKGGSSRPDGGDGGDDPDPNEDDDDEKFRCRMIKFLEVLLIQDGW